MGTIPTIQLRGGAAGGPAFLPAPDGQVVAQGATGQDTAPFTDYVGISSIGIPITAYVFDVYEDGAPMTDGRIFQASHYCWSSLLTGTAILGSPDRSIAAVSRTAPPTFASSIIPSFQRLNAPVVYTTDDNIWTVFYVDDTPPLASAEVFFFRGRFRSLFARPSSTVFSRGLGPSMVPVFINDADLAGTGAADLGSSANSWSLCTVQDISTYGGLANTSHQGLSATCDIRARYDAITPTIPVQSRVSLGTVGGSTSPYVGPAAFSGRNLVVNTATGRAMGYFNAGSWQRTYRRGDASATLDWPGWVQY